LQAGAAKVTERAPHVPVTSDHHHLPHIARSQEVRNEPRIFSGRIRFELAQQRLLGNPLGHQKLCQRFGLHNTAPALAAAYDNQPGFSPVKGSGCAQSSTLGCRVRPGVFADAAPE
jgi:hypothetical protein